VQLLLHPDESLRFGLGELEDRNARPHGDDVGDLLLADLGLLGLILGAPLLLELPLLLRELPLLVAERGRLLELLVLDRGFLVLADLLDLLLELPVTLLSWLCSSSPLANASCIAWGISVSCKNSSP
jgi:hypothetical protein